MSIGFQSCLATKTLGQLRFIHILPPKRTPRWILY